SWSRYASENQAVVLGFSPQPLYVDVTNLRKGNHMARQITTLSELKEYLRSLHANAGHHANGMLEVFPKVLSAVIERMDDDSLRADERDGRVTNAAWASFGGREYFFSYDHENIAVSVKAGSMQGAVVDRFFDTDSFDEISRRVNRLRSARPAPQPAGT